MSLEDWFKDFNSLICIPEAKVSLMQGRCESISKILHRKYYSGAFSDLSLLVGSIGRGTETKTSDIDLGYFLDNSVYNRFNNYSSNGQSALLQEVKNTLLSTYSQTYTKADGQVVIIEFSDGMTFEIVPFFLLNLKKGMQYGDLEFTYPDSNNGGSWKKLKFVAEYMACSKMNDITNGNYNNLCKMIRTWRDTNNVPISGLLIDTLAYNFINNYAYNKEGFILYDWLSRDFFEYLKKVEKTRVYWYAPGSNQLVYTKGNFQNKAKLAYEKSLEAIENYDNYLFYTSNQKWKEIYGSKFPSHK